MSPRDSAFSAHLAAAFRWTPLVRSLVFALAATSIWCLLAGMYGCMSMRSFFWAILLPANIALYSTAIFDRARGDGRLWRAVLIGTVGGFIAALIGEASSRSRGGWPWAAVMAVGIEVCLLASPYARFFDIRVTGRFVVVTLLAHLIFGLVLGLYVAWHSRRWRLRASALVASLQPHLKGT